MSCHEARALFSALVDEALAAGERRSLAGHLAGCADCRRELERFRGTVALVRGLAPARAPAGFVDRVVAATHPTPSWRRLARALVFPLPLKLPLEAAAIVLVAVIVGLVYRQAPEVERAARVGPLTTPPAAMEPRAALELARPTATAREDRAAAKVAERPAEHEVRPRDAVGARQDSGGRADADEAARPAERRVQREATADALRAPVSGLLRAADGDAAERAIVELVERLGGARGARRVGPEGVVLEVVVPRTAWPTLARELGRLGRWQPQHEPSPLPDPVRVTLRIVG